MKLQKALALIFSLFFLVILKGWAYTTVGDLYTEQGDSNWQQAMLTQFYDPQTGLTNFSTPPGVYRKVCSACEYDLKTLSCHCQDAAGLVSYFPTRLKVDHCANIYDNKSGMLKCAD